MKFYELAMKGKTINFMSNYIRYLKKYLFKYATRTNNVQNNVSYKDNYLITGF